MEMQPNFYSENPFQKSAHYRIAGFATLSDEAKYALFIKNLIAFVFYVTDFKSCPVVCHSIPVVPNEASQHDLYHCFLSGNLTTSFKKTNCVSPLLLFTRYEHDLFIKDFASDALHYLEFMYSHMSAFNRIVALTNLSSNAEAGCQFLDYLSAYDIIYPHINIIGIGDALEHYFISVCKDLCSSYIYHFDESSFFPEDFDCELQTIYLASKFDLLDAEEQNTLVTYITRWITQRFKEFAITKKVYYFIHEDEGAYVFNDVLIAFSAYFSLVVSNKNSIRLNYPKYIFSSYDAYNLFDTLARGISIKVSISYVYRLLFENGFIVAKDTPFRNWFNQQSYPIQLSTATETLQKSMSNERKQYVALIAKLLDVTL